MKKNKEIIKFIILIIIISIEVWFFFLLKSESNYRPKCQSAYRCGPCSSSDGMGEMTCEGYYDENGIPVTYEFTCGC